MNVVADQIVDTKTLNNNEHQLPEDPVYQYAVLGPAMDSQVTNFRNIFASFSSSQRSLGSILCPPASVRFPRMRKEQEKTFEKRANDLLAVCNTIENHTHTISLNQKVKYLSFAFQVSWLSWSGVPR